jgi:tRNA U55 pseudouridine synthase TruB
VAELGEAVLTIRVDSQAAERQILAFRQEISRALGDVGEINFNGLERSARSSGERAGRALAQGVTQATQGLRFDSIEEALNFSGALDGTLSDLRTYRAALEALRNVTQATTPGFYQLNDVIAATGEAIRNYSASTDQLADAALRTRVRELTAQLRDQREEAAANARVDREWVQAIRTIESAQRSAAAATRIANQAFRDQVAAVGSLARKGAGDVAGAVGAVGKGVGAAVRAGKVGYSIGAEFGIFEEPKVGPIKTAISQVIERYKFLGEQATTTRGIILRSLEGVGAGAGLIKIAEYADQLRSALNGVSVAGKATEGAVTGLSRFFDYFSKSGLGSVGPLKDVFRALADVGDATSSVTSLTDQLLQLGTKGVGAGVDGVEALVKGFTALPPAAQAAALAAPAVFAALSGPLSVKAKEELNKILSQLDQIQSRSIGVTSGLAQAINDLGKAEFDAQPKLLPPATDALKQPLSEILSAQQTSKNVEDAINQSRERGVRFLEKQVQEQQRLIDQGLLLRPLSQSPVVTRDRLLPPGAPAASLPNPNQYQSPIGPNESPAVLAERRQAQLLDDLADVTGKRLVIEKSILKLQEATRQAYSRQERKARAIAEFGASPIDGRLRDGRLIPGSPAAKKDRQRRVNDAAGSAIIGGAFPLLFGQGLGASLGGGLGGLGGGALGGQFGFGLSLVGTAVGAQFDQASQKLQTLGSALSDPIGKFGELQQAGLLSSKGLERQIQALIDTGRQAEAAALIQKDLATTYGDLQAAKGLARQSDELNRSWTRLTVTLADLGISPLVSLLGETSNAVQGFALAIKTLRDALPNLPTPFGTPKEISQNLTSQGGITGGLARFAGDYAKNFQRILFSNAFLPGSGVDTVLRLGSGLGQVFGANKSATSPATAAGEANAEASTKARQELLAVTRQLITSEAQNNTTLTTGLKLRQSQLQEAQAIANLTETDPKARQVRIEEIQRAANEERARLREQAREAERSGIRDLGRALQLVGVYGTQRQIKEEQLKLDEARRVAEQAQQSFNKSATKDKAEENALNAAILKYRQTELEVTENIRRLETERWANAIAAANRLKSIQEQTAIQQQRPNLTGTGIGALQSVVSFRDAVRAEQEAQARLRAEPGNEQLQQAAQAASAEVRRAAAQTRSDLIDAYNAAKDSVQAISRSIQDGAQSLAELQNTSGQGVNKYLSPQQVIQRQEALNPILLQRASEALNRYRERTGQEVNLQVSGTLEQRNAQLIDIERAFNNENRAVENLTIQNNALTQATNDSNLITAALTAVGVKLSETIPTLATNIKELAGKKWDVNVTVYQDGKSPIIPSI